MSRTLHTHGEYPADWKEISDATCAATGNRCIRCGHPYTKGEHGKGEWTPCDEHCVHFGPIGIFGEEMERSDMIYQPSAYIKQGVPVVARWRILTVHHFNGHKNNCAWWNLLALCQRCHLTIQGKVNPHQPYMFEHSDWLKPYVAGFYANKYEARDLTRAEVEKEIDRLLGLERIA